ncbi:hypothetical protein FIBSPDRAFT_963364 [Athelia psychrophila]|uniref:Uncharacterized protein n=1 Tax=Athelia psychrophila TaxID=1759441 RepID=A0A165Z3C6_9AGAM|nr:hypothetical protein FIBSPDRAFT_963364 [Fibularhizoctonia sp. CBS 109695]
MKVQKPIAKFVSYHLRVELDFVQEADNESKTTKLIAAEPRLAGRLHIPLLYPKLSNICRRRLGEAMKEEEIQARTEACGRKTEGRHGLPSAMRARMFLHIWYQHILKLSQDLPDLYSLPRSFISPASFCIFNRLCDSMLLHILAYAEYYPDHPFCPWLLGTASIEHFFGIARSLLPNFMYAELLNMIKHTMLQQRLLSSGRFTVKRERSSRTGYIMNFGSKPLSEAEILGLRVRLTRQDINDIIELAYTEAASICRSILSMPIPRLPITLVSLRSSRDDEEDNWDGDDESNDLDEEVDYIGAETDPAGAAALDAARYVHLCDEYEQTAATLADQEAGNGASTRAVSELLSAPPPPHLLSTSNFTKDASASLRSRINELSHRVRIAQALDDSAVKEKKVREARWISIAKGIASVIPDNDLPNVASKNVTRIYPLRLGNFVILRHPKIDADGTSGLSALAGDDDEDDEDEFNNTPPVFTGIYKRKFHLHTYTPITTYFIILAQRHSSAPTVVIKCLPSPI